LARVVPGRQSDRKAVLGADRSLTNQGDFALTVYYAKLRR
jgi:hypothetical protein